VEYKSEQYKRACEIALSYGYTILRPFQHINTSNLKTGRPMIIVNWIPCTNGSTLGFDIEGTFIGFDVVKIGTTSRSEIFYVDQCTFINESILIGYYLE